VGAVIKKTYNKPLVVTVHEGDEWFRNEIGNEKCLYAWKSADVIIRVSERDMYLFGKSGISMDKVNYIPNGFDHTLFKRIKKDKARKILGLPLNKKILLTIGKLEERKNQKMVIEAVKSLRKNHKDIQYLILGEGPERPELESIIKTDQLEEYVILVGGNKKRSEIPLWIFASDIFVLPSLSEGNPTVMFEALGCHVPYIGSDVGGSSSIIKNDKVGMLFKSGDISDLINKLDIALSKKWDKEIIRKYSEQFSWKRISEQIYSLYIKIMK
jgi:glycosyltransferase involved in cell wall biosynthesis